MATEPRMAATVILLREPLEVLLMKRSTHDSFMARATVYPGGAADVSDNDPALTLYSPGFKPEKTPGIKTGLFFSAIRELFEESFILLAKNASGEPLIVSADSDLTRFEGYRKSVHDNMLTLSGLAIKEHLFYTPEALIPFAHWITPTFQKTRYDTWFFLARLPEGQCAMHDNNELISAEWIKPKTALELNDLREILLIPPTLVTLHELAKFNSIDDLFADAPSRHIQKILPEVFAEGPVSGVRLPNDPLYSGDSLKQPYRTGEPSRVILENGFWRIA